MSGVTFHSSSPFWVMRSNLFLCKYYQTRTSAHEMFSHKNLKYSIHSTARHNQDVDGNHFQASGDTKLYQFKATK